MIDLDTSDLQIILALRDDSRLSLRDLGAKSGLSAPAVSSRLKRLESLGVIRGYSVILCESAFALEVEALIFTDVRLSAKENFLTFVKSSLCVSDWMKVTGEYSYMIKAAFENIKLLNSFTENLERDFGRTRVNLILEKEFVQRPPLGLNKDLIK